MALDLRRARSASVTRLAVCVATALLLAPPETLAQDPPGRPAAPNPFGAGQARPGLPPRDPARDPAPAPATGTARIRGRVVAADTGAPLVRARVGLVREGANPRDMLLNMQLTYTDSSGAFEHEALAAGRYTVSATKAGYIGTQYGERRLLGAGTPVEVADGQTVQSINLLMTRGGVVSGRLTDVAGEPLAAVAVQAQRSTYDSNGVRTVRPAGASGISDDLGQFRIYGLPPGDYLVTAGGRNMPLSLAIGGTQPPDPSFDALTYYPGTLNPSEAQAVRLGPGEEASLQFGVVATRPVRVAGTVVTPDGAPAAGVGLSLRTGTADSVSSRGAGQVGADGTFSISNVPPGSYVLDVRPPAGAGAGALGAAFPIVVGDADVLGLTIVTSPGTSISGRVVYETSGSRAPGSAGVRVIPYPLEGNAGVGQVLFGGQNSTVAEDGSFRLDGVMGRIVLQTSVTQTPAAAQAPAAGQAPNPQWVLKSVLIDGDEMIDTAIDLTGRQSISGVRIVLTDRLTDVSGTVADDRGRALKDHLVVLLRTSPEAARVADGVRTVRTDATGRFQTRGLRPGGYAALALDDLEPGQQYSPEFQQRLRESGRRLSIKEGERVVLDLPVSKME